jgi:hypothetical protein
VHALSRAASLQLGTEPTLFILLSDKIVGQKTNHTKTPSEEKLFETGVLASYIPSKSLIRLAR